LHAGFPIVAMYKIVGFYFSYYILSNQCILLNYMPHPNYVANDIHTLFCIKDGEPLITRYYLIGQHTYCKFAKACGLFDDADMPAMYNIRAEIHVNLFHNNTFTFFLKIP
jgi:hypothetical protein